MYWLLLKSSTFSLRSSIFTPNTFTICLKLFRLLHIFKDTGCEMFHRLREACCSGFNKSHWFVLTSELWNPRRLFKKKGSPLQPLDSFNILKKAKHFSFYHDAWCHVSDMDWVIHLVLSLQHSCLNKSHHISYPAVNSPWGNKVHWRRTGQCRKN